MRHNHHRTLNATLAGILAIQVLGALSAWAQPDVEMIQPKGKAHPGQPYRVVCEVTWKGAASDYVILPPEIDGEVDWAAIEVADAEAFIRDGHMVVAQTLEITANKTGEYQMPAVLIPYLTPEAAAQPDTPSDEEPSPGSSAIPSLRVAPFPLSVLPDRTPVWVAAGLGGFLLLMSLGWWVARRMRTHQPSHRGAPQVSLAEVQTALHGARRHRLDGDYYKCYASLAEAVAMARQCAPAAQKDALGSLHQRITKQGETIGYGGSRPTDDQLDGDFRDIERALEQCKNQYSYAEDPHDTV